MITQPQPNTTPKPGATWYTAILNQTGTDDPIITSENNQLKEQLTWTRQAAGVYRADKGTEWPDGKTFVNAINNFAISNGIIASGSYTSPNTFIQIDMFDFDGNHQDVAQLFVTIQIINNV